MADTGFVIPTLSEIVARVRGDLNSRMGNSNSLIVRSLAYVLAFVLAGVSWCHFQYQKWISQQVIFDAADYLYLVRWAQIFGVTPQAATKAAGIVEVDGIAGSTLAGGSLMQRADGEEYEVLFGPYNWVVTGTLAVSVRASDAGEDGNYDFAPGATLTLVSPPAGVTATNPLDAAGISGGTDAESQASLLERLLARIQDPPQGGAESDYIAWAQATPAVAVARVWVQHWPDVALGSVKVLFTKEGTGLGVIPAAPDLAAVLAYINPFRPVTANLTVAAPSSHAVTLTIDATPDADYDVPTMRANVLAEIEAMFREKAEVDAGGSTFPNSYLLEAIGQADGVDYFELSAVDGGSGTDNIVLTANQYPTIVAGGITWT